LEEMNKVTVQKYVDMKDLAAVVNDRLISLNRKCRFVQFTSFGLNIWRVMRTNLGESLRPYLRQIDEIDENTRRLEEAATALDAYVTTLGISNHSSRVTYN
jgi:hypothetical protein